MGSNWFSSVWQSITRGGNFNAFGGTRLRFFDPLTSFGSLTTDKEKLEVIFTNPACLKVFSLVCDLFSQGEIYVYDQDKIVTDDPILMKLENPNPHQDKKQFLWDYRFWTMLGTANLYVVDRGVDSDYTKMYFLDPSKLEYPLKMQLNSDKFIFSKKEEANYYNQKVIYRFSDGTTTDITLKDIVTFHDLTNGLGNWFKSPSRIDALYKVITNSEEALNAKNKNIRYSGKFMVAGQADPDNVTHEMMSEEEKRSIEQKVDGPKSIHAVKSMIDIKRFVEDISKLKLDDSFMADYHIIGSMFGIPKEILDSYNAKGSTFENQEKAVGRQIGYSEQPKGDSLMNGLSRKFGYNNSENKRKLVFSFDHLPFMQVFEKDRADVNKIKAETLASLLSSGVSIDEANRFLDTDFKNVNYEKPSQQGSA